LTTYKFSITIYYLWLLVGNYHWKI